MVYTKYSVIMGLAWFALAIGAGSGMLFAGRRYAKTVIFTAFVLGAVRALFPAEFMSGIVVNDWVIYPLLQRLWAWEPIPGVSLLRTLAGLWLLGAVVSLGLLAFRYGLLFRARRRATPVRADEAVYDLCRRAAERTRYEGTIHLGLTRDCDSPVQAGFTELWILLPAKALDLPQEGLVGVMCHEIYHFRSRDLWKKLGLLILRSCLWWNPLVYLFARNVEQLMELRCDERVCGSLDEIEKVEYLSNLTKILRGTEKKPALTPMGYVGIQKGRYLRQRFQEILKPRVPVSRLGNVAALALCVLVFFGSYFVTVQPASLPGEAELDSVMEDGSTVGSYFILHASDGTYELYDLNGSFVGRVSPGDLDRAPYSSYPIFELSK